MQRIWISLKRFIQEKSRNRFHERGIYWIRKQMFLLLISIKYIEIGLTSDVWTIWKNNIWFQLIKAIRQWKVNFK